MAKEGGIGETTALGHWDDDAAPTPHRAVPSQVHVHIFQHQETLGEERSEAWGGSTSHTKGLFKPTSELLSPLSPPIHEQLANAQ